MKRSVSLASGLIFMVLSGAATAETGEHTAHDAPTPKEAPNTLTLSQERLQSIGVKFEEAARRPVEKLIRTVGRVEMDERRMARVNLKIEGWIDRLFVNTTGEKVKKGQELFTLYSPELLATQEEYLLAVRAAQTLGGSEFPEVAEGAKTILDVSRRRLQLWDVADSHIEELERTGKVLKALPFHAPLSGTVIEKTAMAGMRVMPGEVLYTIADLSQVWVLADIYEYELPLVEPGQTATVSLSYAPQATFSGRIGFIYPTVDPETRTAKVRFELENPKELLKPGMYADVQLAVPLGERLAVPRDAVLESGERQVIFIHHGGGKLEWRSVKTGQRSGDWVEILEGLKEGEHIVTSANFLLDSESQLKAAVGGMAGMKH